jgi:hypothetical protein
MPHYINHDAPIPGQSLTGERGSKPWEKPPKYVKVEDAMDYLIVQLLQPDHVVQMLAMMDGGLPVEAIIRPILFGGFMQGLWTMNLAILIARPLAGLVTLIYHQFNKGKMPKMTHQDGKANKTTADVLKVFSPQKGGPTPQQIQSAAPAIQAQAKAKGLMGR